MSITAFSKRFGWRRLLAIVTSLIFAIFYFNNSDGRSQTLDPSRRTLRELLPIAESVTGTVNEDLTENKSSTTLSVSSPSAPPSTQVSDLTALSAPTELSTSSQTDVVAETSASETAVASSNNLIPSAVPEVVQDSHLYIDPTKHRAISSVSTINGAFFEVHWHENGSFNPNILPHPTQRDKYVLVAQLMQSWDDWTNGSYVMRCTASFLEGVLTCSEPPTPLPIAWTPTSCPTDQYPGPHDPRVFYGPSAPHILYGSRSTYSCQGMWVQDLHHLLPDFNALAEAEIFHEPSDVQRPPPYHIIEKNYFLFWDHENNTYVHQNLSPHRVFTSLYANGSVGPDLALAAANTDGPCMEKYMPKFGLHATGLGIEYEAIHQSTNSLAISLCRRSDPDCQPTNDNTFIMVIFQHKSFYAQHAEYFPYVMLFQQTAPFAVHALSTKSIWINGRTRFTQQTYAVLWHGRDDLPPDHSEMFFVMSMSWKRHGQMYHGYIDDEMFLGFGIEDSRSAGIDILASDLLQDLAYCSDEAHNSTIS